MGKTKRLSMKFFPLLKVNQKINIVLLHQEFDKIFNKL